jgi:predicted anti-sigma-YlaC factor YlaD
MPLVHDHLSKCEDCREVYEALLIAIGRERG